MSSSPMLTQVGQSIATFWNDRNERERKQLALAAVVVVLALIYMVLIEPAYTGRIRLEKSVPELRKQAAEMQSLSKDAMALANTSAPPVTEMTKEMLEAGMKSRGLAAQNVAVTGNLAKIQLSSASFAGLMSWLDELQKTARVTVIDANIVAQPQPDTVNATLSLQQQKSE